MYKINIVNIRKGGKAFRVDRKSALGNPYYMKNEAQRDEVCDRYQLMFRSILSDNSEARKQYNKLLEEARVRDISLACWCAPKRCHAETIKAAIEADLAL